MEQVDSNWNTCNTLIQVTDQLFAISILAVKSRWWNELDTSNPRRYLLLRYPCGFLMADKSLIISYCESGRTPNRVYVIRFEINTRQNEIEILPIG